MKLKSTGETVISYPWNGDDGYCPWDETKYWRVLVGLPRKSRKGNRMDVRIVRRDRLEK